jgi:hypothetical protein
LADSGALSRTSCPPCSVLYLQVGPGLGSELAFGATSPPPGRYRAAVRETGSAPYPFFFGGMTLRAACFVAALAAATGGDLGPWLESIAERVDRALAISPNRSRCRARLLGFRDRAPLRLAIGAAGAVAPRCAPPGALLTTGRLGARDMGARRRPEAKAADDPASDPDLARAVRAAELELFAEVYRYGGSRRLCGPVPGDAELRARRGLKVGVIRAAREELRRALELFEPEWLRRHLQLAEEPVRCFEAKRKDRARAKDLTAALPHLGGLGLDDAAEAQFRGEAERAQRAVDLADLDDDAVSLAAARKGGKGPLTRRARLRRLKEDVCRPLRDRDETYWTWPRLESLITESDRDWIDPPCPGLAAAFRESTALPGDVLRKAR